MQKNNFFPENDVSVGAAEGCRVGSLAKMAGQPASKILMEKQNSKVVKVD